MVVVWRNFSRADFEEGNLDELDDVEVHNELMEYF